MSQQINLYAPLFRKQSKVFSATTMLQGLGLIAVVVAVFYATLSAQTSLLQVRATDSSRQLQSELERLKALGAGESPAERARIIAERRRNLEAALTAHQQALAALDSGAAGRSEGYSAALRALARTSLEGVWLTRIQFNQAKGELLIAGRATRADLVPRYLERLRSEEALRAGEFSKLELVRPSTAKPQAEPGPRYVEFTLSSAPPSPAK